MRVLVTGGCGFIGNHLVRHLDRRGYHVTVLDDLSTGRYTPGIFGPDVRFVRGSVLDGAAVADASDGVEAVLHLAGVVGMRLAVSQARLAHRIATEGTANVLAATGRVPVVLFSSSAVYGNSDGITQVRDDLPIERCTPLAYDGGTEGYATGKWDMEDLGRQVEGQRPVVVIRPFNVVGPGQSAAYGMVLPTFIRQALAGQPLTVYDDGAQRRCFSDVAEVTRITELLLCSPDAAVPGKNVFNVGSHQEISIRALAELVVATAHSNSPIEYRPYTDIFPGRTDVTGRVPSLDRLNDTIGATHWLPVPAIVENLVRPPA